MKMKKALSILLVVCMCISLMAGCQWLPAEPTEPAGVEVEDVKINLAAATIKVGETHKIEVRVEPAEADQTVTFTSSDEAVATVDATGLVTAVAEGVAEITVTAGDKSKVCTVTVAPAPVVPDEPEEVNGFVPFLYGGLLGGEGGTYYPVTVTAVGDNAASFYGKGGFSWPDTVNMDKPSAMGGYYNSELDMDGLTFTWRMDKAIEFNGDHWYVIAIEDRCQLFNSWDGSDPTKTLFLMIAISDGKIALQPHYRDVIDLGEAWSYLGKSQGVPYQNGDTVTIQLNKVEGGYEISLNGVVQVYDNIKNSVISITSELFPNDKCWLMTAAHIGNPGAQYEGEYGYTLGLLPHNTEIEPPVTEPTDPADPTDPVDPSKVNGFKAFETGGLVNQTEYDKNITLGDCGGTDRVLVTGRGGTNYGDPNNPRSTMGVYSVEQLTVDGLEILYSVEGWIDGATDHWYAIALSNETGEWFENDGSDNALFFMFQYVNGNVILRPHYIGNGAGWTYLGDTVGVPARGGQYSILIQKTDAGYVVSMKNAEQAEYTPQWTIDAAIVEGLFPDGDACLMAGAHVATFTGTWSFVLGAHEAN